jgi:hypothetical protein
MIPLGVTVGNVAISRWLGAKLSIMEGDRVTLGSELKESLGETLCIPLGVKLGNETLARWLGVKLGAKLGIVEGDREVVTLGDELWELLGKTLCITLGAMLRLSCMLGTTSV